VNTLPVGIVQYSIPSGNQQNGPTEVLCGPNFRTNGLKNSQNGVALTKTPPPQLPSRPNLIGQPQSYTNSPPLPSRPINPQQLFSNKSDGVAIPQRIPPPVAARKPAIPPKPEVHTIEQTGSTFYDIISKNNSNIS
jgi:hypothetical protein